MNSLFTSTIYEFIFMALAMPIWMFNAGFIGLYMRIWLYKPSTTEIEAFIKNLKSIVALAYTGVDGAPIGYPPDFKFLEVLTEFQASRFRGKIIFVCGSMFVASPFLGFLLLLILPYLPRIINMDDSVYVNLYLLFVFLIKFVFLIFFTLKSFSFGKSLKKNVSLDNSLYP